MRGRAEARLDPVRWRRPGHPTLLRAAAVAALVATAALLMWARPSSTGAAPRPVATASASPAAVRPSGPPAVPAGSIGVPIRLAEPTGLKLIHPGDHVDVFRVPETGESPQAIATAALVLGVTGAEDPATGGLLLALTPAEARRTVTAPGGGYAVLIRPDG